MTSTKPTSPPEVTAPTEVLLVPVPATPAATCALTHQSTPCGLPATTVGRLGNHHDDLRTGPLCTSCATTQALVIASSERVDPVQDQPIRPGGW